MGDENISAAKLLEIAAAELAKIHRGKHYAFWRSEAAPRLNAALGELPPFDAFREVWIHTGNGGHVMATMRFGDWAIDRFVEKKTITEIFAAFKAEVSRNIGRYTEVSPVFGVKLDELCDLGDGIEIVPKPDNLPGVLMRRPPIDSLQIPTSAAMLQQVFTMTPAFEPRAADDRVFPGTGLISSSQSDRSTARNRVRLACLLASSGPVELPITVLQPDHDALFVHVKCDQSANLRSTVPAVSLPVESGALRQVYLEFGKFAELDSIARAIDRLGRSRLAPSPVDRALELGIAAEIALMHGLGEGNAEIAHKIGTRAAWLLGRDPADRENVSSEMKKLYAARSQAVHSGVLTSRSKVDLDAADRLVARVLLSILKLGRFPNWSSLTMGGDAIAATKS